MKKIYIQQDSTGQWLNENCFSASKGFAIMQYDINSFEMNNLEYINISKENIYHGGINTIRKIINLLEIKQPKIHNPHEYLPEYLKREMIETTLGGIKKMENELPFFIKPLTDHKLFDGFVVKNLFLDMIKMRRFDDNTQILKSPVLNFLSEYRCFIHNKKLVGCKNYAGDFKINPNFDIIENAIKDYKEQPIAYSLDFAITDKNETVLIEINDGFSLGSYGLDSIIYSKMIKDRWLEIIT